MAQTFDILTQMKFKHGGLARAVKARGTQKGLAEYLNVSPITLHNWLMLRAVPNFSSLAHWPAEKAAEIENKLFELTGQTLDELWPKGLREAKEFLKAEKTFEVTKPVELTALILYAGKTNERLTYDPVAAAELSEKKEFIARMLPKLPARDQQVLTLRFGIDGGGERTLKQIADEFGVTVEAVRAREKKALTRLRAQVAARRSRPTITYETREIE